MLKFIGKKALKEIKADAHEKGRREGYRAGREQGERDCKCAEEKRKEAEIHKAEKEELEKYFEVGDRFCYLEQTYIVLGIELCSTGSRIRSAYRNCQAVETFYFGFNFLPILLKENSGLEENHKGAG